MGRVDDANLLRCHSPGDTRARQVCSHDLVPASSTNRSRPWAVLARACAGPAQVQSLVRSNTVLNSPLSHFESYRSNWPSHHRTTSLKRICSPKMAFNSSRSDPRL
ncbi:hypothetical protein GQ53DRAFT_293219 [Thozetella sp. PMI_491]|nr:hypothetical protein GQ53DRAFT_293219 [Thozetella sp. PMI_491]